MNELRMRQAKAHALSKAVQAVSFILLVAIAVGLLYLTVVDHRRLRQSEDIQRLLVEQSQRNGDLAETNKAILDEVRSCTTPKGECAQRNNGRTGEAIGRINSLSVAANFCAIRYDGDAITAEDFQNFTQCVKRFTVQ